MESSVDQVLSKQILNHKLHGQVNLGIVLLITRLNPCKALIGVKDIAIKTLS